MSDLLQKATKTDHSYMSKTICLCCQHRPNMNIPPTPYNDLNLVLDELVKSVREILEGNFLGAYLQGSFAVGDFDRHSDADFIIVINEELSDPQLNSLQEMHKRIYNIDCPWAQYLEGSYFPKKLLRLHSCDSPLWYLDNGSCILEKSRHDNFLHIRSVLYDCGVRLAGPPIRSLINLVPVESLRDEIFYLTMKWGNEILSNSEVINSHFYQSFAVLSFCRALHDIHTGRINSKRAGALWIKANLDASWNDLIDRSWSGCPSPEISSRKPAHPDELRLTIDFIRYMMAQIKEKRDAQQGAPPR